MKGVARKHTMMKRRVNINVFLRTVRGLLLFILLKCSQIMSFGEGHGVTSHSLTSNALSYSELLLRDGTIFLGSCMSSLTNVAVLNTTIATPRLELVTFGICSLILSA